MSFNNRSMQIRLRNTDTQEQLDGRKRVGKDGGGGEEEEKGPGLEGGGMSGEVPVPGEPGVDSSETDDHHSQQDDQQPRGGRDQILDRKKTDKKK
jgi:hypothetical protein